MKLSIGWAALAVGGWDCSPDVTCPVSRHIAPITIVEIIVLSCIFPPALNQDGSSMPFLLQRLERKSNNE
jgi:hypothetical protein